jgi:hypothetical protein
LVVEELSAVQLGCAMRAAVWCGVVLMWSMRVCWRRSIGWVVIGRRGDGFVVVVGVGDEVVGCVTRSGRLRRAKVLEALPVLGDKLAAGEVSAAHVDALAAVLPAKLVPTAGGLVAEAGSLTPEELAHKAQQLVAAGDGDGGAGRNERLRAQQSVTFFDDASGMRAVLGKFDPTTAAGIESAIDYLTDELWRREHPDRSPTLGDRHALAYRRADALAEMCRRSIAGTLATRRRRQRGCRRRRGSDDGNGNAEAPSAAASTKRSRRAKLGRVTARTRPPAPWAKPLLFALIDYRILRGDLDRERVCELFDGTPIAPIRRGGWPVTPGSFRWCWEPGRGPRSGPAQL